VQRLRVHRPKRDDYRRDRDFLQAARRDDPEGFLVFPDDNAAQRRTVDEERVACARCGRRKYKPHLRPVTESELPYEQEDERRAMAYWRACLARQESGLA